MFVSYRIWSGLQRNSWSPIFPDDKFRLVELCLHSFVRAFQDVKPTCAFILDGCDERYYELVDSVPFPKQVYRKDGLGNLGTHHLRLDLAAESGDKVVILDEDYFWVRGGGKELDYALDVCEFAAFYDHVDNYRKPWADCEYRIKVIGDRHWRRVHFTTLSFATHAKTLREYWSEFHRHADLDWELYEDLCQKDVEIWSPLPSLATHMAQGYLSPGIDWKALWHEKSPN